MSGQLNHECGIAVVRLRKPLAYFQDRYGDCLWGFKKLFLLMEKQHNRGQDGVGIGCAKLNMAKGQPYIFRRRDAVRDSLARIFRRELKKVNKMARKEIVDLVGDDVMEGIKAGIFDDFPIWEHKIYREKPVFCQADTTLVMFRKWVRQFYL